jgi:hypothetical protein
VSGDQRQWPGERVVAWVAGSGIWLLQGRVACTPEATTITGLPVGEASFRGSASDRGISWRPGEIPRCARDDGGGGCASCSMTEEAEDECG